MWHLLKSYFMYFQVRPSQLRYFHRMKPVMYSCMGSGTELRLLMTERKNRQIQTDDDMDEQDVEPQYMNKQQYVNERMKDKEEWKSSRLLKSLKKTEDSKKVNKKTLMTDATRVQCDMLPEPSLDSAEDTTNVVTETKSRGLGETTGNTGDECVVTNESDLQTKESEKIDRNDSVNT